jgi:hypothetical protein
VVAPGDPRLSLILPDQPIQQWFESSCEFWSAENGVGVQRDGAFSSQVFQNSGIIGFRRIGVMDCGP